jgi:tetratricopeptide (TPR) repeat protein
VIAKDALFAPAYAGLAAAYAASSAQGFRDDHADELTEMRAAAEKAIRLDPLLAEAHDALGMVYTRDGKWAQSEESFRRAIELDRSNSGTYNDFSIWLLLPLGRIDEAVHQMRLAEKADPLSPWIQSVLAWALLTAPVRGALLVMYLPTLGFVMVGLHLARRLRTAARGLRSRPEPRDDEENAGEPPASAA